MNNGELHDPPPIIEVVIELGPWSVITDEGAASLVGTTTNVRWGSASFPAAIVAAEVFDGGHAMKVRWELSRGPL